MDNNWMALCVSILVGCDAYTALRAIETGKQVNRRGPKGLDPAMDEKIYQMAQSMTYKEIAEKLGICTKTVKKKIDRHRDTLQLNY